MTQAAAQLSMFGDEGEVIAAAVRTAQAVVTQKKMRAYASARRATKHTVSELDDANTQLPDGLIDQGGWNDDARLQANFDALSALSEWDAASLDTPDDATRDALAGYVGWGGLASRLDDRPYNNRHPQTQSAIKSYLPDTETWDALKASVLTAYYTPESLIDAIWAAVRHLGFTGGRVLEPAAGTGHFIGRRPHDLAMDWTAVECEPVAARIAGALYPSANVIADKYEQTTLPNDGFDLAISNIPFGSYGVTDKAYTGGRFASLRIHDYYFLKTLDKVRPGGLIAFVTTHGTLDKTDTRVRREIAKRADLLGAFRLPGQSFKASANTDVIADVIFLQKRETKRHGREVDALDWIETRDYIDNGHTIAQNPWFDTQPLAILGTRAIAGAGMYGKGQLSVTPDPRRGLFDMAGLLPNNCYIDAATAVDNAIEAESVSLTRDGIHGAQVGAYALDSAGVVAVVGPEGVLEPVKLSKTAIKRVELMIPVRDAAYQVIAAQVDNAGDGALAYAQTELRHAYNALVKRYGPINKPANRRAVSSDPALALLLSLEHYDEKTQTATPSAIFTERTIGMPDPVLVADDPHDALAVSLNEHRRVVPDRLCALLDQEWPQIREALRGAIYREPESGEWQTASRYLSGNVVDKLEAAQAAASNDPQYQENVDALARIQPEPLGAGEIDVNLGSPWVPAWVFHQFIGHMLGMKTDPNVAGNAKQPAYRHVPPGQVSFTAALGLWKTDIQEFHCDRSTYTMWGTSDFTPTTLIEHGLNQKLPVVWATDSKGNKYKDLDASNEAQEKLAAIKEAFAAWLWECPERTDELCTTYNRRFNCRVEREYDGSHLTFPGLSLTRSFRWHQRNFAWRVIEAGNAYAAHVVGSGKTGSMMAAAMESKRLGLARKPCVVVPNNLLYSFAAEAIRFYPSANVLIARKEDIAKEGRRRFLAKVSSQNWDLVVMTHESFGRVPLSADYVSAFIKNEVSELNDMLIEVKAADGDRITLKNLEQAKRRLETKLDQQANRDNKDDGGLFFEALGVDMLLVDEAHCFKNLEIKTRMGSIPGVTNAASQRALDLFMKTRWIMEQSPDEQRGVVFASGTPISNSMTELYTNLKYLAPALCVEHDIVHFDSWAAAFGEVVTALERAPEGKGYRMNQRFASFINVPELSRLFRNIADIKMADDLDLPTPEADRQHHVCEPSEALTAYMAELGERAQACRNGMVDKTEDNILKIANDGRHASLDMRLVDPAANDTPDSKARLVAATVDRYYDRAGDNVQLVFCDLATPKAHRFSIYTEIRDLLIDRGIPEAEIVFAQNYKTDAQREAMYAGARAGQLRVILGSTAKMGMGMNAQDKISDIHHVDAPWRPADIEQRDGRGIRQGNEHACVRVHTYVTRDAYDEFMWETLKRKAGFIVQALTSPEKAQRRISDTVEPKYAEIMALASGDPRIREKVEIDDTVDRLKLRYRYHRNGQARIERRLDALDDEIKRARSRLIALDQDLQAVTGQRQLVLASGAVLTRAQDVTKAVRASAKTPASSHISGAYLGTMGGFEWRVGHCWHDGRKGFALICDGMLTRFEKTGRSAPDALVLMGDLLDGLPEARRRTETRLESLVQEQDGLIQQQGLPFEEQAALDEALGRQAELHRALTDEYEGSGRSKAA